MMVVINSYLIIMVMWGVAFAAIGKYDKAIDSIIFFVVMPFILLFAGIMFVLCLCLVPLLVLFSKSFREKL